MSKIAFTADWHFRGSDLPAAEAQVSAMICECESRSINTVVVIGDVFDSPVIGDNKKSTGAIAGSLLRLIAKANLEFIMISGNHDQAGAGSADALHVFAGLKNVTVCREPSSGAVANGWMLVTIPWCWAVENAEHVIAGEVESARVSPNPYGDTPYKVICAAHVEVTGARMAGSYTCEPKPGKWQVSRSFIEALPIEHIALGHFHARQDLTGGRGGYVGAIRQLNFGEEGNPHGFEIFDTDTGATEWIELDAAPRYRTVILTPGMERPEPWPNEKLRIRIDGADIDAAEIRKLENQGAVIEKLIEAPERIQRADVPPGIIGDNHGLLYMWAENQNPPVDGDRLTAATAALDKLFADGEEN